MKNTKIHIETINITQTNDLFDLKLKVTTPIKKKGFFKFLKPTKYSTEYLYVKGNHTYFYLSDNHKSVSYHITEHCINSIIEFKKNLD